jgi:hypothetical protein
MPTSARAAIAAVACIFMVAACSSPKPSAKSDGSNAAAAGAGSTTTGSTAVGNPSCPSAAAMSTATGDTLPAPQQGTSSGTVTCNYNNTSSGATLVIIFAPAKGITTTLLKSVVAGQASAQNATPTAVTGLGSAAYIFTEPGSAATNINHVASTDLSILAGSELIDLTGPITAAHLEAAARIAIAN